MRSWNQAVNGGNDSRAYTIAIRQSANKALVLTAPALCNFSIIARPNRFGGGVGAFLPHMARERRHNAGVSLKQRNYEDNP